MNARSLVAAAAVAAVVSPLAASAASLSIGSAYSFDLQSVEPEFVNPSVRYNGVDGYFVGAQTLQLQGFTAATGLSIDRLESVSLRFEGQTRSTGSGGVWANSSATVPGGFLNLNDLDSVATERDSPDGRGIAVFTSESTGPVADGPFSDLTAFAADTIDVSLFTNIAFYGSLGQVTGEGRGFTSAGFATLDYVFNDGPVVANAVPTPSAALAGLFGLAGVTLRRRKSAPAA